MDSPIALTIECGGYHGLPAIHLDYVGHAALTDRLLDTDLEWSWEPVGFTPEGLPALDRNGGLWIKLTVCGVTRYGYGAADGKSGGDAMKEMIGDALRNAAMRFGAALDLWHKGDLHADDEPKPEPKPKADPVKRMPFIDTAAARRHRCASDEAKICEGRGRYGIGDLASFTRSFKAKASSRSSALTIEKIASNLPGHSRRQTFHTEESGHGNDGICQRQARQRADRRSCSDGPQQPARANSAGGGARDALACSTLKRPTWFDGTPIENPSASRGRCPPARLGAQG
jgi:hypothetical protein